jgi:hypothetical protein
MTPDEAMAELTALFVGEQPGPLGYSTIAARAGAVLAKPATATPPHLTSLRSNCAGVREAMLCQRLQRSADTPVSVRSRMTAPISAARKVTARSSGESMSLR